MGGHWRVKGVCMSHASVCILHTTEEDPEGQRRQGCCSWLLSKANINPGKPGPSCSEARPTPSPPPAFSCPWGWCCAAVSRSTVDLGIRLWMNPWFRAAVDRTGLGFRLLVVVFSEDWKGPQWSQLLCKHMGRCEHRMGLESLGGELQTWTQADTPPSGAPLGVSQQPWHLGKAPPL